jgi:cell division protein FtsN
LIFGIGRMVLQVSDPLIAALTLGFGLAAFVLPGLFGNAVFHADCRKRMARALVGHNTVTDACAELTRQAPTRRRAIVLFAVNVAAVLVAVFIYLQVSAFSTLTVMPHGALEVGQISVAGPTENPPTRPVATSGLALSSAAAASAAVAPVSAPSTVASAPLAPASSPASSPKLLPASAPVAVARRTTASAPMETAIAPASAPARARSTAAAAAPTIAAKPQRAASVASMDTPDKPYFINVGLFAVPSNAAKVHAKLLEAQLPSVTRVLKSSKGPLTRVRVGPFTSREKAQEAVEKIQALQLDAVIVQP